MYRLAVWRENVARFAYPTVERTLIAPDRDDRPTACNAIWQLMGLVTGSASNTGRSR